MELTKDLIFQADDIKKEKVHVPEWNGDVYVKMMTAAERDRFESDMFEIKNGKAVTKNVELMRAKLVGLTACGSDGVLLFSSEDIPKLATKSASAIDRLFAVAQKLNRLTKEDVDELTKN